MKDEGGSERTKMSTVIMRSFADSMGLDWPPDVARVLVDHSGRREVTWAEVMAYRREEQRSRLDALRRVDPPRTVPCYVWVFHVPGWLYGGWWCDVVTLREQLSVNFRWFRQDLALSIMRAAPCGFLPLAKYFDQWMPAFAEEHVRGPCKDPRRAGTMVGWLTGEKRFTLIVEDDEDDTYDSGNGSLRRR